MYGQTNTKFKYPAILMALNMLSRRVFKCGPMWLDKGYSECSVSSNSYSSSAVQWLSATYPT